MSATKYKQYLGDSVYADFDGLRIVLTTGTPGQTKLSRSKNLPDQKIILEGMQMDRLAEYCDWLEGNLNRRRIQGGEK